MIQVQLRIPTMKVLQTILVNMKLTLMLTEINTKASIKIISCMERALTLGLTEINTKASIKMIRGMERALSLGLTEINTKASIKMIRGMERALSLGLAVNQNLENGMMVS